MEGLGGLGNILLFGERLVEGVQGGGAGLQEDQVWVVWLLHLFLQNVRNKRHRLITTPHRLYSVVVIARRHLITIIDLVVVILLDIHEIILIARRRRIVAAKVRIEIIVDVLGDVVEGGGGVVVGGG